MNSIINDVAGSNPGVWVGDASADDLKKNHNALMANLIEAAQLVDEYIKAQRAHDLNEFGELMDDIKAKMKANSEHRASIGAITMR